MAVTPKYSSTELSFREGDNSFTKDPWEYRETSGGLTATAHTGFLRCAVDNQSGRNLWCVIHLQQNFSIPSTGLVLTTRLRLNKSTGNESKFNIDNNIIVRVMSGGSVTKYQYYQSGRFFDLSDSSVSPDSTWHVVTVIYLPKSIMLFEDGDLKFTWERSNEDGMEVNYSSQVLDSGSSASMDRGDTRISPLANVSPPPSLLFTPETDLTKAPWVQKQNPIGPSITSMDGFMRFDDKNQTSRNQWVFLSTTTPVKTAGGASTNFRLRLTSTKSSEVKLTLAGDVIIRWTRQGSAASYCYYEGGFRDLAPCDIVSDNKWHDISVVYESDRTTLYEDGTRKFTWEKNNGEEQSLHFDVQVLDAGSGTVMDISNVGINEGLYWKQ